MINKEDSAYFQDTSWVWQMKGAAIFGIILYHWFCAFDLGMFNTIARLGGQGVHVFFILSAFGLAYSFFKHRHSSWGEWYRRRFEKILYPYYCSVIIIIVSIVLYGLVKKDLTAVLSEAGVDRGSLCATIFLYRGFVDKYVMCINSPWWFVVTIVEFYLIFPVILGLYNRSRTKYLTVSLFITLIYQALYSLALKSDSAVYSKFFLSFLFEFSCGILLADLYLRRPDLFKKLLLGIKPLVFGIAMEGVGTLLAFTGRAGVAFNYIFNAAGFFIITFNMLYFLTHVKAICTIFDRMGRLSVSIFLLHAPYIPLFFEKYGHSGFGAALSLLPVYLIFVWLIALLFEKMALEKTPYFRKYFIG